jgi:Na+/Pi-cotransporter
MLFLLKRMDRRIFRCLGMTLFALTLVLYPSVLGQFPIAKVPAPQASIVQIKSEPTLLESSSVTIIRVIAMVSADVLTFVLSPGVVLGSDIGTAVGAQIITLDIKNYVPLLMFAGLLALFLGRTHFYLSPQDAFGFLL